MPPPIQLKLHRFYSWVVPGTASATLFPFPTAERGVDGLCACATKDVRQPAVAAACRCLLLEVRPADVLSR